MLQCARVLPFAQRHYYGKGKESYFGKKTKEHYFNLKRMYKQEVIDKLGIPCISTRIIQPFRNIWKRVKRSLGIEEDGGPIRTDCAAIQSTQCEGINALEPRVVDRSAGGCPNNICKGIDDVDENEINMASKCVEGMKEPSFGFRARVRIIDDAKAPCEDPRYKPMCDEAMANGRIANCPDIR